MTYIPPIVPLITRSAFDQLDQRERFEAIRAGYRVVPDPDKPRPKLIGAKIYRSDWEKLDADERMEKMKTGWKLVD